MKKKQITQQVVCHNKKQYHHHHGDVTEQKIKYLCVSFFINIFLSCLELIGGVVSGSVSLIGDALHNTSDAFSILIAVISFKENKWGGLVSQGIGTSMLQMGNIIKNPRVWIAPIVASAITGPLATCVFGLRMNGAPVSSGMGTCGLLGPIGIILGWFNGKYPDKVGAMDWIGLLLICFILPALLSWGICLLLRKLGWIKENDMKL